MTVDRVTAGEVFLPRLVPAYSGAQFVGVLIRFLLDRELKEAILSSFDVSVVGRYFPEYEGKLAAYLDAGTGPLT